jgi:hypothetical protein
MFAYFDRYYFISDKKSIMLGWLGAADANQSLWLNTNPNSGSLPHPN